jgi:hypothetical protein
LVKDRGNRGSMARGRASGLLNWQNEINAKDDGKYRKIFCGA